VRGFTLLETVITTALLGTGLVAVAAIFSYSAAANITTMQRTTATVLLYEKMEQFKSVPLTDAIWATGGGLNARAPAPGYFDYVELDHSGGLITSTTDSSLSYIRMWQISGTVPRAVTVVVCAQKGGATGRSMELIRAAAITSNRF
jgi:prepilin-type N-terminal cleavage/methylation domain-containing protein